MKKLLAVGLTSLFLVLATPVAAQAYLHEWYALQNVGAYDALVFSGYFGSDGFSTSSHCTRYSDVTLACYEVRSAGAVWTNFAWLINGDDGHATGHQQWVGYNGINGVVNRVFL